MSVLASNGARGIEKCACAARAIREDSTPRSFQWSFIWIQVPELTAHPAKPGGAAPLAPPKNKPISSGRALLFSCMTFNRVIFFVISFLNPTATSRSVEKERRRRAPWARLKSTPLIPSWVGVASKLPRVNSLETWLSGKSKDNTAEPSLSHVASSRAACPCNGGHCEKATPCFWRPSPSPKLLCGCGPVALHPARSKMEPHLARAFF